MKKGKAGKKAIKLEKDDITVPYRPKTPASRSSGHSYSSNAQTPSVTGNSSLSLVDSPGGSAYEDSPAPGPDRDDTPGKPSDPQESPEDNDGMPKLKGVCYPGMGMFDAATPEQKRMRNQRKDKSVIDQMAAYSASIVPNEYVFNLNFELQRVRNIYDPPSVPNSPVSLLLLRWLAVLP